MNGMDVSGGLDLRKRVFRKARRQRLPFFSCLALLAAVGGCGPVWILDPDFGERYAREQNKPLFWYFKDWDSTQHRNMKLEVFNNPAVKTELMDTVNVEVEFGWFEAHRNRYKVRQPQVCVMCKPDGTKVSSSLYVNPVPTPEEFLSWFQKAKSEAMPPPTSQTTAPKVRQQPPVGGPSRRPSR